MHRASDESNASSDATYIMYGEEKLTKISNASMNVT